MTNLLITQPVWKILKTPISFAARRLLGTITHVETREPVLALTFDDGPHPEYTPRLLDILNKYHASATFFCVGKFAAQHPEIIRQTVKTGHIVGNHSWDHSSLPLLTHHERCEQVRKCAEALAPHGSRLFRPPYRQQSLASRLNLLQQGYEVIGWTHAAGDRRLTSSNSIFEHALLGIGPGRIIVFHDRLATARAPEQFRREATVEAVRRLLERFSSSYRFVTVPELFRYGTPVRDNWYHDADASWLNEQIKEDNVPSRQYPTGSEERIDAPFYM